MLKRIRDSFGHPVVVEESESAILTATFYDTQSPAQVLAKTSILTLTASLINKDDGAVINSRNDQDILDTNGGTVATDGTLTLKLQPADNTITRSVGTDGIEVHYLQVKWTWQDADLTTLTGRQEWELHVRQMTTPVA